MGGLNVEKNRVTSTLRCKVVVAGAPTVGKTSLCQMTQSSGSLFPKKYNMTVGVDVSVIPIRLEGTTEVVELFAYDVGGQDVFVDCCEDHLHDADYVFLCFDLFDRSTLTACQDWLSLVNRSRKQTADPPRGVLVGNKADLEQPANAVDPNEARSFASASGLEYFEVSSLPTWQGNQQGGKPTWREPFDHIARDFKRQYEDFLERARSARGPPQ